MSDPRYTDPRYSNSRLSDPVGRRDSSAGGPWGWIAGIVVIALIAIFLIVGGKNTNTASNAPGVGTTGTAPMASGPSPRSTTGMGSPSQFPAQPPANPNPASPPK